ncbi:hypothetical protein B0H19DRAFT_1103227 [Mycena capillaripes]|nr:hypothetical protein B0H19DRAFT_1103227 [Mycena capillaripes]
MPLRWPARRGLHTSAAVQSTYRGYNMHGTLREWALRQIRKEDLGIHMRSKRARQVQPGGFMKRTVQLADEYVLSELRKQERNNTPPKGRAGRLVRAADRLVEGAEDPFAAHGRAAGERVVRDRAGRLREALRLYMRASQRPDGTMPIIGSRVWGTTTFLERRIINTTQKLDIAEKVAREHYAPVQDTVNWGVRQETETEKKAELIWAEAGAPKDTRPSARGLAYKARPTLPPLHRLPPSAVARARMPLMQAFPGVGGVAGNVLSLGHGLYASRGLLGTPPASSTPTPATALSPTGEPRPFYTSPTSFGSTFPSSSVSASSAHAHPAPFHVWNFPPIGSGHPSAHPPFTSYTARHPFAAVPLPSSASAFISASASPSSSTSTSTHDAPQLPPRRPDPTTLRGPPWTRRGKMLRWMRYKKKREELVMRYFPAPHVPPPASAGAGAPPPLSQTDVAGVDVLAWVRSPPPRAATPSLAHALRMRLAGRLRV